MNTHDETLPLSVGDETLPLSVGARLGTLASRLVISSIFNEMMKVLRRIALHTTACRKSCCILEMLTIPTHSSHFAQ